jgi:FemAB-related protein (PEP-CTERM system-associated)
MMVSAVESGHAEWNLFVQASEDATAYHFFGWKAVFARSFGHQCHYLAAIDDNGEWRGVLPLVHLRSRIFGNFLVSLPFVNYGGLLCESEAAAALLLDEAEKIRRSCGATHVELRHVARKLEKLPTKQHKVSMILELAGSTDAQWKAFDPKLRNQIRKAQKSGLQFRRGHLDLIDDFYEVFARNMRDLGTPVYSKHFFRNVMETFPDTTAIATVFHEGKAIAAGLASWFRNRLEIPWASSIKDYKALCPNHMLYWESIRFAIERGFREFDFGRSTPNEGTYNFKKQWGALPIQLNWQYLMDEHGHLPDLNPGNPKYQAAIRVWQCLPVTVTKVLGPLIVRNIP